MDLRPRQLWNALRRQSLAFWALNFYLMLEYVRPQTVWPAINVLPWAQVALAVTLLATLLEPPMRKEICLLDGLLIFFSLVVLASVVTAFSPAFAVTELNTFVNWVVLYYLITRVVTTEVRLVLLFVGFTLWSLKMSQFGTRAFISIGFGFRDWGVGGAPGWFRNSGEFAIQMCVFLPMVLHVILGLRARWSLRKTGLLLLVLPTTALISLVASSSRGGQLGGAAVLIFMVAQSRHRVRGLVWAAVLLPALWFIVPPEQKLRFSEMGSDGSSVTRFKYWADGLDILRSHPVLGIGYDNWMPYYQQHYSPPWQLPHNIFIEAGAELGYLGLIAFVMLIGGTFQVNARTRRMARSQPEWQPFLRSFAFGLDAALVGYLVSGFFVTVLFYPYFWVNLSFSSALYLIVARRHRETRRRYGMRSRRSGSDQTRGSVV